MNWFEKVCSLGAIFCIPLLAEESCNVPICKQTVSSLIELKGGYFFFASQKMRTIYPNGGFEIQLSGSYPIAKSYYLYGSIGFCEARGKSLHFHQKTSLWQVPIDAGFKPILKIASCMQWYTAFGPRFFYVQQNNDSPFVDQNQGKTGLGFFVNTGFNFHFFHHLFIDLYGEYSYEGVHFSSSNTNVLARSIQVGGFDFGAGFGCSF